MTPQRLNEIRKNVCPTAKELLDHVDELRQILREFIYLENVNCYTRDEQVLLDHARSVLTT